MPAVNATRHITATVIAKENIGKKGTRENATNFKKNSKRNRQQQKEKSRTMYTIELVIVFSFFSSSCKVFTFNFAKLVFSKFDGTCPPTYNYLTLVTISFDFTYCTIEQIKHRAQNTVDPSKLSQCSPTRPPRKIPTAKRMAMARKKPPRPPLQTPIDRHPPPPIQTPPLPQKPKPRPPSHPRHCPKRHTWRI